MSSLNLSVFDALAAGAVDFVQKPNMSKDYNVKSFFNVLNSKIYIASRAKVNVKHQAGRPQSPAFLATEEKSTSTEGRCPLTFSPGWQDT